MGRPGRPPSLIGECDEPMCAIELATPSEEPRHRLVGDGEDAVVLRRRPGPLDASEQLLRRCLVDLVGEHCDERHAGLPVEGGRFEPICGSSERRLSPTAESSRGPRARARRAPWATASGRTPCRGEAVVDVHQRFVSLADGEKEATSLDLALCGGLVESELLSDAGARNGRAPRRNADGLVEITESEQRSHCTEAVVSRRVRRQRRVEMPAVPRGSRRP